MSFPVFSDVSWQPSGSRIALFDVQGVETEIRDGNNGHVSLTFPTTGFEHADALDLHLEDVPGFNHVGGVWANAQPAGVPVERKEPGRSVMPWDR